MTSGLRWDPLVLAAVAVTGLMTGVALQISAQQEQPVAWWFVAGLLLAGLLGGYGVVRAMPGRTAVLIASGVLLLALGTLGILSIGLPVIGAGVLTVVAAVRSSGIVRGTVSPR